MDESSLRWTEPGQPPNPEQLEAWLGSRAYRFWLKISEWIAQNYPGVFAPAWLYGGKQHGWSLRYKKSKSFCTLIPERQHLRVLIVFGAAERAQVETIRQDLVRTHPPRL